MTLPIFICHTQERDTVAIDTRAVYACLVQSAQQKFRFVVLLCSHNTVGRKRGKEKVVSLQLKGKNYQYGGSVLNWRTTYNRILLHFPGSKVKTMLH